jgi:PAT family beta-lactamase induction signal transducer AmpG
MQRLRQLLNKKTLIIIMMGLSSGLPLALVGGTLQAWMKSDSVNLATIGFFAMATIPYTLKFFWAPAMDRFQLTRFGRRRSWMLLTQVLLILSVLALSFAHPKENLAFVAAMAVAICFFSASQDIVIDAWRRESLSDDELGWGSSVHVTGYLFAFRLLGAALALFLSDLIPWSQVYQIMAAILLLGILATFLCEEPQVQSTLPKTIREAVLDPFRDYFKRPGAWLILAFILLYKIGDNMAFQMTTPFFLDLGFTRTEVGVVSKIVGWIALSVGGLAGGALILRLHIRRALFLFGVLQAVSILSFSALALAGKSTMGLAAVLAFENFAVGMSTSAFVAFLASLTNKRFTATQYALLSSFMGLPRSIAAAPTGLMADHLGWPMFYVVCAVLALPGLLMIGYMRRKDII